MKRLADILLNGLAHVLALLCLAALSLWIAWIAGYKPMWREADPAMMSDGWRWSATRSGVQLARYVPYAAEERGPMAPGPPDAQWIADHTSHDFDHALDGFLWQKKTHITIVRERSWFYPFVRDERYPMAKGTEFADAVPYWAIVVVCGAIPCWRLRRVPRLARRAARFSRGRCISCGYDLHAASGRCPECGTMPMARPSRRDVARIVARSFVSVLLYGAMLASVGLIVLWLASFDTGVNVYWEDERSDRALDTIRDVHVHVVNGELEIQVRKSMDIPLSPRERRNILKVDAFSSQTSSNLSGAGLPFRRFGVSYYSDRNGDENLVRNESEKFLPTVMRVNDRFAIRPESNWFYWFLIPRWMSIASLSTPFCLLSILVITRQWRRGRFGRDQCQRCGYDLRVTPDRCPECGTAPAAEAWWSA